MPSLAEAFATKREGAQELALDALTAAREIAATGKCVPAALIRDVVWLRDESGDEVLSAMAKLVIAAMTRTN